MSEVPASSPEQACSRGDGSPVLASVRHFLDVVSFSRFYGQIQLVGFGTSLNSIVAAETQHPVHLSFFHCKKGLISRTPFSSSRQFRSFSLWRKLRWRTTPQRIQSALHSKTFSNRVELWSIIIQDLGSNPLRRFTVEKHIRSNSFGLQGCYCI